MRATQWMDQAFEGWNIFKIVLLKEKRQNIPSKLHGHRCNWHFRLSGNLALFEALLASSVVTALWSINTISMTIMIVSSCSFRNTRLLAYPGNYSARWLWIFRGIAALNGDPGFGYVVLGRATYTERVRHMSGASSPSDLAFSCPSSYMTGRHFVSAY